MSPRLRAAVCTLALIALPAWAAGNRYRVTLSLLPDEDARVLAQQIAAMAAGEIDSDVAQEGESFVLVAGDGAARAIAMHPRVSGVVAVESHASPAGPPLQPNAASWSATYAYDGSGNVKSIARTGFTEGYVYDKFGRLLSGTVGPSLSEAYTYDVYGNRVTRTVNGGTPVVFDVSASTNRLTSVGGAAQTYDDAGRLTSNQGYAGFTYDALDTVTESTINGSRTVYLYNASDERIASFAIVNNTPQSSMWTLRDPSARVLRRFTMDSPASPVSWREDYIYRDSMMMAAEVDGPEKRRFFHTDHLGTPRLITGNGGAQIGFHSYYPFGSEWTTSQEGEAKKFTSHERDRADLDYMHARYYNPAWGRFLSVDPVIDQRAALKNPQMWNRYAYVHNNPTNKIDPDGKLAAWWHYIVTFRAARDSGMGMRDSVSLAWRVVAVDRGTQGTDARSTNIHAMRGRTETGRTQTVAEARTGTQATITSALRRNDLATAIHTAQDRAAPHHADKAWRGRQALLQSAGHLIADSQPGQLTLFTAYMNTMMIIGAARDGNSAPLPPSAQEVVESKSEPDR